MKLGTSIEFVSGDGGSILISEDRLNLQTCGIVEDYVFFEDVQLKSEDDIYIDISSENTEATLETDDGNVVLEFGLNATSKNSMADFKFTCLEPDEWYRLKFNGNVARSTGGVCHGRASNDGKIKYNNVEIPEE